MIRFAMFALGLIAFTNPTGVTVFIDSGSIVSVAPGAGRCTPPTLTYLDLGQDGYCVKESVADAVAKVKAEPEE